MRQSALVGLSLYALSVVVCMLGLGGVWDNGSTLDRAMLVLFWVLIGGAVISGIVFVSGHRHG